MRRLLALTLSLATPSCATPYQDMGFRGGVEATRLDNDTLSIGSRGNAYTDKATIQDYALLKAAEETVKAGNDLFLVAEIYSDDKLDIVTTSPATSESTSTFTGSGFKTTTTYYPPQTTSYAKPGTLMLVKMFKGEKPLNSPPTLFSAHEIIRYLGPEYKR